MLSTGAKGQGPQGANRIGKWNPVLRGAPMQGHGTVRSALECVSLVLPYLRAKLSVTGRQACVSRRHRESRRRWSMRSASSSLRRSGVGRFRPSARCWRNCAGGVCGSWSGRSVTRQFSNMGGMSNNWEGGAADRSLSDRTTGDRRVDPPPQQARRRGPVRCGRMSRCTGPRPADICEGVAIWLHDRCRSLG